MVHGRQEAREWGEVSPQGPWVSRPEGPQKKEDVLKSRMDGSLSGRHELLVVSTFPWKRNLARLATLEKEGTCPLESFGHLPHMQVEIEREEDGRWIAEVSAMRGALAHGVTKEEAIARVEALVLRAIADKLEHGEEAPEVSHVFTVAA